MLGAAGSREMAEALRMFWVSEIQVQQLSWEQSIHARQPHLHRSRYAIWKAMPSLVSGSFPCLCQTTCQQVVRMLQRAMTRWTTQPEGTQPANSNQPFRNSTWKPPVEAVWWAASFLRGTCTGSRCSSSSDRPLEVRRGPPLCAALPNAINILPESW